MTSRFVRLSISTQVILIGTLVILPVLTAANSASAQTYTKPLVFEIKNLPTIPDIAKISNLTSNTPSDDQEPPVIAPVDPNIAILQNYLTTKGSPLAPYAAEILQFQNWKLVLAISNGESTMCKHQLYNNCWGVGGAWNLKRYASFAEGFSDVDQLLGNKYIPQGADTPKEIVRKYVGSYSPTWVSAVSQVLSQLDQLPLQS